MNQRDSGFVSAACTEIEGEPTFAENYTPTDTIHAGLLQPAKSVNHIGKRKGIPNDSVRVETALGLVDKGYPLED